MVAFEATPDIVSLGEAMVEFNQTNDDSESTFLQGYGGDTSNFAIAASRQGAKVAYISAVGDDVNGKKLRSLWQVEGVDQRHVHTFNHAFTGIYFVTHDKDGHHFSFYRSGSAASLLTPANLPFDLIAKAKVLHLSGISLAISNSACDAAYAAIDVAKRSGVKVSFDTNLRLKLWSMDRARAVMTDVLRLCDICLPSYDDITAISGLSDPEQIADFCHGLGAEVVALKLGANGALVSNRAQRYRLPAFPCKPVDATGAGDTFGGAFVSRLVAGDDVLQAGRYASVAAALSTESYGAVNPIPNAAKVGAALSKWTT
jgi:2-dehydro-3-deoxygluconokinase